MPAIDHRLVRDKRDELDLSNRDLAHRLDTTTNYVVNIMCGSATPSLRMIYRLSRALDLSVDKITAAGTTPQGDPSEPPVQPPNAPTHPPRRQDTEDTKGPKKARSAADAA